MPQVVPYLYNIAQWAWGVLTSNTWYGYIARAVVFTAASNAISKALSKSSAMGEYGEGLNSKLDTTMDSMPTKRYCYGESRVGGTFVYAKATKSYYGSAGSYTQEDDINQQLHFVIEICGHTVEEIEEIYLEDEALSITAVTGASDVDPPLWPDDAATDTNGVQRYRPDGTSYDDDIMIKVYPQGATLADKDLVNATSWYSDNWGESHIGTNRAWVYIRCNWNTEIFQGYPKFSFKLKGKNDIRDPRCDVDFTADPGTDTLTAAGHGMSDGDVVWLESTGSLPSGIALTEHDYYVVNATTDTFQLANSRGGTPIVIVGTGSGTHSTIHRGGYRTNPALCLADYLTVGIDNGGMGEDSDQIDQTALITAANECDEDVAVYNDGTTQKRYFMGGSFLTSETPDRIIREMLASMAGWCERINGQWHISAGTYTAPAMTLTESEMRSAPTVSLNRAYRDIFNSARATIAAEDFDWHASPSAPVEAIRQVEVTSIDTGTDTFTAAGHGLENGDRVRFISWNGTAIDNGNLPGGLDGSAYYYVIGATTNTYQVSLTSGGSAVDVTSTGSGTIFAFHDIWLTRDGERITQDYIYSLVNDQTLARRLAIIELRQARQEKSARVYCKPGTAWACPFDLKIGDSVRWIDAHKDFWESITSPAAETLFYSTFDSDASGVGALRGSVSYDAGPVGGESGLAYYVANSDTLPHGLSISSVTSLETGARYRLQANVYIPAGNTEITGVAVLENNANTYGVTQISDSMESIDVEFTAAGTPRPYLVAVMSNGSYAGWTTAVNGDEIWVDSLQFDKLGWAVNSSGVVSQPSHGLSDGDPVQLSDAGDTGWQTGHPYYVVNATTDTFQLSEYRGGAANTPAQASYIDYTEIQGKLFRVTGWKLVCEEGIIGIDLDLAETASDTYDWTNNNEVEPPVAAGITTDNVFEVTTPSNLAVTSGSSVLYIRQDGTVGSRAKLTWDESGDAYVRQGGRVDIEYRQTPDIDFTTDYASDANELASTAHTLPNNAPVKVSSTGTLPAPLQAGTTYWVVNRTADTLELSTSKGGSPITLTSDGSGTHSIDPFVRWTPWGSVSGGSTEAYVTDVEDGADYDFRIRFRNAFGNASAWDRVDAHTIVGKTAAPAGVTGASATSARGHVKLDWTDPSDLDLAYIKIRRQRTYDAYGDAISGPFADDAIFNVAPGVETFKDPVTNETSYGGYQYLLEAVDTSGNVSSTTTLSTTGGYQPIRPTAHSSVTADRNSGTVLSVNTAADQITTSLDHGFADGEKVLYRTTGSAIGGLSNNTWYVVEYVSPDTFSLAPVGGGGTIDLTSSGSGTQTFHSENLEISWTQTGDQYFSHTVLSVTTGVASSEEVVIPAGTESHTFTVPYSLGLTAPDYGTPCEMFVVDRWGIVRYVDASWII